MNRKTSVTHIEFMCSRVMHPTALPSWLAWYRQNIGRARTPGRVSIYTSLYRTEKHMPFVKYVPTALHCIYCILFFRIHLIVSYCLKIDFLLHRCFLFLPPKNYVNTQSEVFHTVWNDFVDK